MSYTLTHQEKAFINAYRLCVGSALNSHIEYYFSNRERVQLCDYKEERLIMDGCEYWSHIEDFYLLWREAIEFANKPPLKTYKVIASYQNICETTIEAENENEAYLIAKDLDGGIFKSIDQDDWNIERVVEVTK
jgi:hypothetical protein